MKKNRDTEGIVPERRADADEVLARDQRERFERDGYLIMDSPAPNSDTVDAVIGDLDGLYVFNGEPWEDEQGVLYGLGPRIRDAWKISESVKALGTAPRVMAALEQIYGRRPLPFQTLNFPTGTQQRPHSDSMHFDSDPPGLMCAVWVALEAIDMSNGPLVYYPGSHKLADAGTGWSAVGWDASPDEFASYEEFMLERNRRYEEHVAQLIDRHDLQPQYATIRKGQALVWHANLIHGGAPQSDRDRTRHSQVTHYFFEGCRTFTPMRTEGERVYWTYPEWITPDRPKDAQQALCEAVEAVIPEGATPAVVSYTGQEEIPDVAGREWWHFPQREDRSTAVGDLEDYRAGGASHVVVPKSQLPWFTHYGELQQHLERNYRWLWRDGGSGVIFALD
jgi:hypothetical protein